ncbi:MAG: DnaJ domain-containing protein [Dolichospermum sp.]
MSLKINSGLFSDDFIDHHAVLCVTIDAEVKEIRQRYLQIVRILHPDSSHLVGDLEKEIANSLLSKLVNPAYQKLTGEKKRREYLLILSQMGKRLAQEAASIKVETQLAKELLAAANVSVSYQKAIAQIAETQFNDLQQAHKIISEISELNLVYLMRTSGQNIIKPPSNQPHNPSQKLLSTPTLPLKEESLTEKYLHRAQNLLETDQLSQATVELQDALKLEPRNSHCHSLMAMVYLKQNQLKMAKIHFDNALKLNPKDKIALEWKPKVDQALGKTSSDSSVNYSSKNEEKQPDKSGKGGLFGGLFGGKKK